MMKSVKTAMDDADVYLLVSEVEETFDNVNILHKLEKDKTSGYCCG